MVKDVIGVRTRSGFTLVEVMIVIAVLGILMAITLPRFGGLTERKLENEARRVQSDLRLARTLAVASGVNCFLMIYPLTNEYKIYKGAVAPGNQVGETRIIKSGITASGNDTFIFEALGNANAASGTSMNLTSGSVQYNIAITAATGMVTIAQV